MVVFCFVFLNHRFANLSNFDLFLNCSSPRAEKYAVKYINWVYVRLGYPWGTQILQMYKHAIELTSRRKGGFRQAFLFKMKYKKCFTSWR